MYNLELLYIYKSTFISIFFLNSVEDEWRERVEEELGAVSGGLAGRIQGDLTLKRCGH